MVPLPPKHLLKCFRGQRKFLVVFGKTKWWFFRFLEQFPDRTRSRFVQSSGLEQGCSTPNQRQEPWGHSAPPQSSRLIAGANCASAPQLLSCACTVLPGCVCPSQPGRTAGSAQCRPVLAQFVLAPGQTAQAHPAGAVGNFFPQCQAVVLTRLRITGLEPCRGPESRCKLHLSSRPKFGVPCGNTSLISSPICSKTDCKNKV